MRCPKDGAQMAKLTREHKCLRCGFSRPRFIKPDNGSQLFVSIVSKNEKTEKFLQDVEAPKPKRSWYLFQGNVYIKENGKIVDVRRVGDFAKELAHEVRKR